MFAIEAAALHRTLTLTGVRPYTVTIAPDGVTVVGEDVTVTCAVGAGADGPHTRRVADVKATLSHFYPTAAARKGAVHRVVAQSDAPDDYQVPPVAEAPAHGTSCLTLPAVVASALSKDAIAAGASVIALVDTCAGPKAIATDRYTMVVRDLDVPVPAPIHISPLALRSVLTLAPGRPIAFSTDEKGRSWVGADGARALSAGAPLQIAGIMARALRDFADQTGHGQATADELLDGPPAKALPKLRKIHELDSQPTTGRVATWTGENVTVYATRPRA